MPGGVGGEEKEYTIERGKKQVETHSGLGRVDKSYELG